MLSLNYENINYVMTQILKLSCASFSYVNISYVLADVIHFEELAPNQSGMIDISNYTILTRLGHKYF